MTTIQLKPKREENVLRFHPWIFSGAMARVTGGEPEEGDPVRVTDSRGTFWLWGTIRWGV